MLHHFLFCMQNKHFGCYFFFFFNKNLYFKNVVVYCSDTGTVAPERCVFGIMLDVSAFLGNTHTFRLHEKTKTTSVILCGMIPSAIRLIMLFDCVFPYECVCVRAGMATVYVRYKQVEALTADESIRLSRLNLVGLVLGFISSFGMCVVANFQKTTLFPLHMLGAVLTFGVGAIYILVQTLISLYMQPQFHSRTTYLVRLCIGVWTLCSIISSILSHGRGGRKPFEWNGAAVRVRGVMRQCFFFDVKQPKTTKCNEQRLLPIFMTANSYRQNPGTHVIIQNIVETESECSIKSSGDWRHLSALCTIKAHDDQPNH